MKQKMSHQKLLGLLQIRLDMKGYDQMYEKSSENEVFAVHFSFPPNYCIPEKKLKHFYRIQKNQMTFNLQKENFYKDKFLRVDMPQNIFNGIFH